MSITANRILTRHGYYLYSVQQKGRRNEAGFDHQGEAQYLGNIYMTAVINHHIEVAN